MKLGDIRSRMLLGALLPVTLVAVLLSAVFLLARVGDINEAHSQRARSLARQLATASEYGLFSANIKELQSLASGAMRESDVRSVRILDARGQVLARAGKLGDAAALPAPRGQELEWLDSTGRLLVLVQPVTAAQLRLDDVYEARAPQAGARPQLLGHVFVEVSRETMTRLTREMWLAGIAVSLGGLLFGGLLAVRLGRGVIRPILRVSALVERIGNGELSARAAVSPGDPLRDLQLGLNQMAQRLESGRDEMEERIAAATLELRAKKEEAESATLAKSRFLAAASHDLRQPIHALGMFVARLAQLPHDAETGHLIVNLEASVRAMQDMLDALLDISRLDANAVPVHRRAFALADVFEQLRAELAMSATEKGLRLRIRPIDVWLHSDPVLIHRILLNLAVNSLRYTRQGWVLVACRAAGDGIHARIEVWDSGIGIAPEHHDAIFGEFFQVGNIGRDRRKGLGLGLNIVQRNAKLLGHRLRFTSRLGVGTRFSIEVPLAAPGATNDLPNPPEGKTFDDLAGLVVLVVEDDILAREGLASLLTSWGCIVRTAEDLSGAQRQLKQGRCPDVLVSDYRLRDGENGIETIRQLRRAAGRSVPACLMSGDTDPGLMQAAKDAELTLLHKPVRPAKLRSLIRRLASGAQSEGDAFV